MLKVLRHSRRILHEGVRRRSNSVDSEKGRRRRSTSINFSPEEIEKYMEIYEDEAEEEEEDE